VWGGGRVSTTDSASGRPTALHTGVGEPRKDTGGQADRQTPTPLQQSIAAFIAAQISCNRVGSSAPRRRLSILL
jgi:hypothetical protein